MLIFQNKIIVSLAVWLLGSIVTLIAQDSWLDQEAKSQIGRRSIQLDGHGRSLETNARRWLSNKISAIGPHKSRLSLTHSRESSVGMHLTYKQHIKGFPVFGSNVKLNLDKSGKILSLFYKTLDPTNVNLRSNEPLTADSILSPNAVKGELRTNSVIFKANNQAQLALQANVSHKPTGTHQQFLYSPDGDTLYHKDLNRYARTSNDTTAMGYVFYPNPLKTAEEPYGKPLSDNNDKTNEKLNQQRKKVGIKVQQEGKDSFILQSPDIRIGSFSAPTTPYTYGKKPSFLFARDTSAFEDFNAFYHLNRFNAYMDDLGLTNIIDYQLPIDAHALSDQDNSKFVKEGNSRKGRLYFGEGGVDDAEDAEIIIHEYGHAISAYASPGSFNGPTEAQGLEEGLCDYLACSYSRHLTSYNWEKLFTWDAGYRPKQKNNVFWKGRSCKTDKQYPEDLVQDRYADGQIWAGTFMEVWEQLGREVTDHLVLSALNSFSSSMTMEDGARLVLQADSLLYNGEHYKSLLKTLDARGLVNAEELGVENEAEKAEWNPSAYYNQGYFIVDLSRARSRLVVSLQNLNGKVLNRRQSQGQTQMRLESSGLASGIYILKIQTSENRETVKVIKP